MGEVLICKFYGMSILVAGHQMRSHHETRDLVLYFVYSTPCFVLATITWVVGARDRGGNVVELK